MRTAALSVTKPISYKTYENGRLEPISDRFERETEFGRLTEKFMNAQNTTKSEVLSTALGRRSSVPAMKEPPNAVLSDITTNRKNKAPIRSSIATFDPQIAESSRGRTWDSNHFVGVDRSSGRRLEYPSSRLNQ